ncbi:MAG TPA: T9SS type A sorting domain-containing protein [Spirosoma sp.]|nr:T9SS type A sorting domain-containing protein [Spirosoma sp.]
MRKAACPLMLSLVFSIISYQSASAQLNSWQSHVSYRSGRSVAVTAAKIYAATLNGFFSYDKTTGETATLGKQHGLSDVGISRLLYLPDQNRLLLAYRSGNIDFLSLSPTGEPRNVLNVNTIVIAANLPVARSINHINRIGNNAYLSTDFGVVVLDLVKNEIRDTYFSQRTDRSARPVYQTAATTDSLYALTAPLLTSQTGRQLQAVRFAPGVNIADPGNWQAVPGPGLPIESITASGGQLSITVNGQGVYSWTAGRWTLTQVLPNPIIRQFPGLATGPILATDQAVTVPGSATFSGPLLTDPREAGADGNRIWVADAERGLLVGNAGLFGQIIPEGPTQDLFNRLYAYPNWLVALPSGPQDVLLRSRSQPPAEIFAVPDGRWQSLSAPFSDRGFNSAAYLPTQQQLYLGSFGEGLWRQANGQAPRMVTLPASVGPFISSLATDLGGNLWITTGGSSVQQATLHVRRPDSTFQSFPAVNGRNLVQAVADDNGFLWLRPDAGSGLIVFDPATNRIRYLTTQTGQGGLLTNSVRVLVKDRTGSIWVGTDLGPTVFDNPAGVFDGAIDAQPPLLNRRRLLANEVVTSIAVDGGNRKWIGTQTGLYHVAPDGSQLLSRITADNSPLPGNSIQAIAIEPISGRVFIQTGPPDRGPMDQSYGIVSYRGSATEPAETLNKLTIFPNPVRPDFSSTVGINGLTDNATVKVLDAAGQLVYETRSQGGTAVWNLRDYRNRPAQTGVYLIVVVTADGTEGLAGKLAVVR